MCLNLINSQYRSISEVEFLLDNDTTEKQIIEAKDSRREIKRLLKIAESSQYINELGI